jgi:tRNA modification GTPase
LDTIFALTSARGKAGVAVIRLSGPQAWSAGRQLAGTLPPARQAALRRLRDSAGDTLDDALVLCFATGASFTGEDVVELHLHGSPAIISAVLHELSRIENLRPAEPGEFTRRALENNCLDLAQIEGLGALIEAETEAQRKQAQKVFEGALGRKIEVWRGDLIRAVSLLEATIDFADEDVPVDVTPEVLVLLDGLRNSLSAEIAGSLISERIREGFEVAIIGPPNIGKSTLLNRLAGRAAAITSETAGTTRDVIEVRMDLGGLPVTILDTAGIRETEDHVEGLGVNLARSRAESADLRVFLTDDNQDLGVTFQNGDILAIGKGDLLQENKSLAISGVTGQGISALVGKIQQELQNRALATATATHLRHRLAMELAISHLDSARDVVCNASDNAELAADDLHRAIQALDALIGRVGVEQVLDEIFASFCIGK